MARLLSIGCRGIKVNSEGTNSGNNSGVRLAERQAEGVREGHLEIGPMKLTRQDVATTLRW